MTAKIKYKFGRMLSRWPELTTDEKIVTICVISLFLPYYLVAVPSLLAVMRALLKKDVRQRMKSVSSSAYVFASFPIFTLPPIFFHISFNLSENGAVGTDQGLVNFLLKWFGLWGGMVIWLLLVFMVYLFSFMKVRFYNNLIDLMLIMSLGATAFGVADKFFLHLFIFQGRTSSFFFNANFYGYMIEMFVIMALYRFEKRHSPGYLLILFVNLGSILLCDCRTAWAALAVALVFYAVHYKHNVKWIIIIMLVTVVIIILILWVPMFSDRLVSKVLDHDVFVRSRIWGDAIEWIRRRPLFGYGMNSYRDICILTHAKKIRWHSHNLILNVMLDFGVAGLAYFSCMIGKFVSVLNKPQFCASYVNIRNMIMIAALATMIHGVTDVPILSLQTALTLIIIVSGCSVERNERVFKRLTNFCEIYER